MGFFLDFFYCFFFFGGGGVYEDFFELTTPRTRHWHAKKSKQMSCTVQNGLLYFSLLVVAKVPERNQGVDLQLVIRLAGRDQILAGHHCRHGPPVNQPIKHMLVTSGQFVNSLMGPLCPTSRTTRIQPTINSYI